MIRTLSLLSISLVASTAIAQNSTDWGEIVPDQVYSYEKMKPVSGYYTAAEAGLLRCYTRGDIINVYVDADHETIKEYTEFFYNGAGEKVCLYDVSAGETVYFYNAFPMEPGEFRISAGSEKVELYRCSPSSDGGMLSISSNYTLTLDFSIPVKCSKCKLEVNGESAELTPDAIDSSVIVNWFSTIRMWYREGKINEGDVLTLTLTGIRDVYDSSNRPDFGDGLGKLVLKYTMAARPLELTREVGTPNSGVRDFMTYYMPGSDEGIVQLIFSSDLDQSCRPVAEIGYGDQDNIDLGLYYEYPPVKVEGNMVSVDLQGVTRFPNEMVPGLAPLDAISLKVSGIKGPDGQYVLTGSSASPYSFIFNYNLKSVVYSVAADWVPVAGSQLAVGDEMEIWVLNGSRIMFDSVDFSFVRNGETAVVSVPYSSLRVEKDPYSSDAMLYYLSAPSIDADEDSEINVTFGGLICADGLDHSSDIFVRYKSSTSGVDAVESADSDAVFYDLTGRRVISPAKGIYIRNGKKIIR